MLNTSGRLAATSGLLGATASCLGKFAFDSESAPVRFVGQHCTVWLRQVSWPCTLMEGIIRFCLFLTMLACNAYMLGSFVAGMEESGSVAGTALSSAANFVASAAFGYVFWEERFTPSWWIGFSMILGGVAILSSAGLSRQKQE